MTSAAACTTGSAISLRPPWPSPAAGPGSSRAVAVGRVVVGVGGFVVVGACVVDGGAVVVVVGGAVVVGGLLVGVCDGGGGAKVAVGATFSSPRPTGVGNCSTGRFFRATCMKS